MCRSFDSIQVGELPTGATITEIFRFENWIKHETGFTQVKAGESVCLQEVGPLSDWKCPTVLGQIPDALPGVTPVPPPVSLPPSPPPAAPADADSLASLFKSLSLDEYLPAFLKERYLVSDLTHISPDEMKELIPHAGPRTRLTKWLQTSPQTPAVAALEVKKDAPVALASVAVIPSTASWSCRWCSFLNKPSLDVCELCHTPREKAVDGACAFVCVSLVGLQAKSTTRNGLLNSRAISNRRCQNRSSSAPAIRCVGIRDCL